MNRAYHQCLSVYCRTHCFLHRHHHHVAKGHMAFYIVYFGTVLVEGHGYHAMAAGAMILATLVAHSSH